MSNKKSMISSINKLNVNLMNQIRSVQTVLHHLTENPNHTQRTLLKKQISMTSLIKKKFWDHTGKSRPRMGPVTSVLYSPLHHGCPWG